MRPRKIHEVAQESTTGVIGNQELVITKNFIMKKRDPLPTDYPQIKIRSGAVIKNPTLTVTLKFTKEYSRVYKDRGREAFHWLYLFFWEFAKWWYLYAPVDKAYSQYDLSRMYTRHWIELSSGVSFVIPLSQAYVTRHKYGNDIHEPFLLYRNNWKYFPIYAYLSDWINWENWRNITEMVEMKINYVWLSWDITTKIK